MISFTPLRLRMFLGCCVLIAFAVIAHPYVWAAEVQKPDSSKTAFLPYKATTVDECLRERACVWYAFSRYISSKDVEGAVSVVEKKKIDSDATLFHKWAQPVTIRSVGKKREVFPEQVQDAIVKFQPFFPYPLKTGAKYNFLVLFVENMDRDISETYRNLLRGIFKSDLIYDWYNKIKQKNTACMDFDVSDPKDLSRHFMLVFINFNADEAQYCLKSYLFEGLGFSGALDNFPFSFSAGKNGGSIEFTQLDLFLIHFLYQPEFVSGMKLSDAQKTFDAVYPRALSSFLKKTGEKK